MVTSIAFWLEGREFEPHPSQAFFYFFLSKWDKKWRNMWASEGVHTGLSKVRIIQLYIVLMLFNPIGPKLANVDMYFCAIEQKYNCATKIST